VTGCWSKENEHGRGRPCLHFSHAVVVISADAYIHQREMSALALLLDSHHALVVLSPYFKFGNRAASFIVFVAGQLVVGLVLMHIADNNIVGFMAGATLHNFLAVLLQFLAIEVQHFLRRIVGLVFNGDDFQAEDRSVDDNIAAVIIVFFLQQPRAGIDSEPGGRAVIFIAGA